MINEIHLIILGLRLWKFYFGVGLWQTEGTPVSVEADVEKCIKYKKWVLGSYHSHPNGMRNFPSRIDMTTFYSWGNSLGKQLHFLIDAQDMEIWRHSNSENPVKDAIACYHVITYPYEDRMDQTRYIGHAYKLGRLFFWKGK